MSTVEEIKRDVLLRTKVGVLNTREEIYRVIERCLQIYYGEYEPNRYVRTSKLMNSLVRETDGDNLGFRVYFDVSALNYITGTWDGQKVLDTAMTGENGGSHGGWVDGVHIWDDSMGDLGSISALIRRELIAAGLPIK